MPGTCIEESARCRPAAPTRRVDRQDPARHFELINFFAMEPSTRDKKGPTTYVVQMLRALQSRVAVFWTWLRPEIRQRGRVVRKWAKDQRADHLRRAKILYRWMRRRATADQPVRSIGTSILRLLHANLHELIGWPPSPSSTKDKRGGVEPEFTPYTPELDTHFQGLPGVGNTPPPPGEPAPWP